MIDEVRGVDCYFFKCQALESGAQFHRSTLELLKRLGVVFYKAAPYPSSVELNPEQELESDGMLFTFIVASHPLLQPSDPSWGQDGAFQAMYRSGVVRESFAVGTPPLRADFPNYETVLQDIATGHGRFLKSLIPVVKPRLAFSDYVWGGVVKERHIDAADLQKLFWITYFSSHYVQKHGMEFLMNIPAWNVEELDGGVLVTVTETFLDFAVNEPKETLKYLKQKFKNIRPNRFKIHPAF